MSTASGHLATPSPAMEPPRHEDCIILDLFADPRRRGGVIGSRSTGGQVRQGVDVEGVLAVDHDALRIQPLIAPGWGRSGVAYGPVKREPGLTLAVHLVNGHNLSQTYEIASFPRQVWRWLDAAKSDPIPGRMVRWLLFHRPRESIVRKLRAWYRARKGGRARPTISENLAVGWFSTAAPADPLRDGNALVVHGPKDLNNGELWAGVGGRGLRAFRGLLNVPVCYIVVLRERGAAYYAASLPGANGLGAYPSMRPIAVDPCGDGAELYAGVHQAVLGEIGFGVDTRVYGVKAARVATLAPWYGTAHAADELSAGVPGGGAGADHIQPEAQVGGRWRAHRLGDGTTVALLHPDRPSGLVHAMVERQPAGEAGILWRARDAENAWSLVLGPSAARLEVREGGAATVVAEAAMEPASEPRETSVQVLDDGATITASIDGRLIFERFIEDPRLAGATGVGVLARTGAASDAPPRVRRLEAHPPEVPIPPAVDLGPSWSAEGGAVLASDRFVGGPGPLEGHRTDTGGKQWRRVKGPGAFELTGVGAARIKGEPGNPCPGRTFYTIDWDDPSFADLDLELTPPGTGRFQKQYSRAGVVFWQDPRNYILVCLWLDDSPLPASISSFFCLRGFEDIYDAVWTCIGPTRASWGTPMRLRVTFDADRYLVRLNDEPVLYRAVSDVYPSYRPIRINRVGLAATWEWGLDTGTQFRDFTARGRAR